MAYKTKAKSGQVVLLPCVVLPCRPRGEGGKGKLFDEAIADSMNSNDVLRCGRVFFDFLSQPGDMIINRARNRCAVIPPNFIQQLIARDDLTSMPDQVTQDLKFARREV